MVLITDVWKVSLANKLECEGAEARLDTGEFQKGEHSFTFGKPGTYTITNTAHANIMTVTSCADLGYLALQRQRLSQIVDFHWIH